MAPRLVVFDLDDTLLTFRCCRSWASRCSWARRRSPGPGRTKVLHDADLRAVADYILTFAVDR
jgi:hypothetical protein